MIRFQTGTRDSREFLTEAEDIVEKIEEALTTLSEDLENHVLIDDVLRNIHTLKGGSKTVGFGQLSSYADFFEQTLVEIVEGSIKLDQKLANKLLLASDFFFKLIDALKNDFNSVIDGNEAFSLLPKSENTAEDSDSELAFGGQQVPKPADGKGLVLIVEDNPEMAELTAEILKDLDLHVEITADGSKAIERYVKGLRPDLIITDLKMPKMSGLDLIRRFKDIAPSIPFIVCSGFADRKDMAEFINHGAFGFVEKPVTIQNLVSLVTSGLREKRIREKLLRISLLNRRVYQQLVKTTSVLQKDYIGISSPSGLEHIDFMLNEIKTLSKEVEAFRTGKA